MQTLLKYILTNPAFDSVMISLHKSQKQPLQITLSSADGISPEILTTLKKSDPQLAVMLMERLSNPRTKKKKLRNSHFVSSKLSELEVYQQGLSKTVLGKLSALETVPPQSLTPTEYWNLVGSLAMIWNTSKTLRKVETLSADALRGYFKQRDMYEHSELKRGVENYVKWHDIAMTTVDDQKPIWVHTWDFSKFLRSDKAMSHVNLPPDQFQRIKHIPLELWSGGTSTLTKQTSNDTMIETIAQSLALGQPNSWPDFYMKNKAKIDARVEEIQNV